MLWTLQVNQANGIGVRTAARHRQRNALRSATGTLTGTHTTVHGAYCGLAKVEQATVFCSSSARHPTRSQRYPLYCDNIAMCY